ncbi:family 10 glycosylhydrolase [Dysgonomonas sp. 520]|uniref:family 10 glycosylhydrolase n=1 Tax=Dysgonomonas sp. 520 TaxID=2302931 RepID=UPI0013CF60F6|nr:family 10 glycosylhydrolase [Dysgonomonas sp. 520]
MRKLLLIFISFAIVAGAYAQVSPKREMRATWFTTVFGLDWPKSVISTTGDVDQINRQKATLIELLDAVKAANINTVLYQARGRADAMYKSSYEPWATGLVSTRGLDPGYDPLEFAIEEAHKRGLELHVWINPYRFESTAGSWDGQAGDYRVTHPKWVITAPTEVKAGVATKWGTILDPGNPEVRAHVKNIIGEIVNDYDIDGVLFDDYFYLQYIDYQGLIRDQASIDAYKPSDMSIKDWRRENVNTFVAEVYDTIKTVKPYAWFGIGPPGKWSTDVSVANKYGVSLPAGITGGYAYEGIYADALAWMKSKTIDYISPQIYWATTETSSNYTILCEWWSDMASLFNTHIFVSQNLAEILDVPKSGVVKIDEEEIDAGGLSHIELTGLLNMQNESEKPMLTKAAIPGADFAIQIENNRLFNKNNAPGSVFYNTSPLLVKAINNYFASKIFTHKSLTPAMMVAVPDQGLVTNLRVEGNELKWNYTSDDVRYAVYAIPNDVAANVGNFATSQYLQGISYSKSYAIAADKPTSAYKYAVSVYDRYANEYSPVIMGGSPTTSSPVTLISPANNASPINPFGFTWQPQSDAEYYIFELSDKADFSTILYKRDMERKTHLSTIDLDFLKTDEKYYWRVKTIKVNAPVSTSETRTVVVGTEKLSVTYPAQDETISLTPTVTWQSGGGQDFYILEVSNVNSFTSLVHSVETTETSYTLPEGLLNNNYNYFFRVKAVFNEHKYTSDAVKASTQLVPPPVPVIIEPANGSELPQETLLVKWEASPTASGFRVELSKNASFPIRETSIKSVGKNVYEVVFDNIDSNATSYLRMRANYGASYYTAWSEVYTLSPWSSIGNYLDDKLNCYINGDYLVVNSIGNAEISVSVLSLSGKEVEKVVKNRTVSGVNNEVALPSHLNRGVYLVRIEVDKNIAVLKWIH